jgi:hypothetical protein
MRTMSTQMGSPAGNEGRTKGLPEVQESLLEHAPTENRPKETVARNFGDINERVNCPSGQEIDRTCRMCGGTGVDRFPMTWWELQDAIQAGTVRLVEDTPASV